MSAKLTVGLGAAVAAVWSALPTRAQEPAFVINPIFSAGLTYGGDSIASYDVHLGDVDAGGTLFYYGGINFEWPRRHLALVVQGGRFVTSVSDYDFEELGWFERWPIEAIAFFERKRLRGGIGAVRHLSPTFEDKTGTGIELTFPDASGTIVQFDYLFPRFSLNGRYVFVDYDTAVNGLRGDHFGVGFTWRFGRRKTVE